MGDYIDPMWNATYKILKDRETSDAPVSPTSSLPGGDVEKGIWTETEALIITVILCIFSVVGTLGNGLVLYVFTKTTSKLTSTIFILALAGTDFVTCLVTVPYTVVAIQFQYQLKYDIPCKIYQFLITCTIPLSAFIMVAIAVDRYICICHPFAHVMTVKRAKVIVGILASFACVLGFITAISFSVNQMVSAPASNSTTHFIATPENYSGSVSNTIGQLASTSSTLVKHESNELVEIYTGLCEPSNVLFTPKFVDVYQKIHSAFFLCSLIIVLILYGLIYSSVTKQRAKRRAQKMGGRVKQVNTHCQTDESTIPLTHVNSATKGNHNSVNLTVEMDGVTTSTKITEHQENGVSAVEDKPINKMSLRKSKSEHNTEKRDHDRLANIKTAVMLFIVTIVFLIAFLPAWLMALDLLNFNVVVFYMYFAYNIANPVIYAFMNQMFRDNMCRLFSSCREYCNSR